MNEAALSLLPGAPSEASTRLPTGLFAIDLAISRIGGVPFDFSRIWSADDCPDGWLVWLAWALSVDDWHPLMSSEQRRQSIRSSRTAHLTKGTRAAVQLAVEAAGYGQLAEISEGIPSILRDGSITRDGQYIHSSESNWATYAVMIDSNEKTGARPEVAQSLIDAIKAAAPARCAFLGFNYVWRYNFHNNQHSRNGTIQRRKY